MYHCKYCSKEYENPKSVASHTKWCKQNPDRYIPFESINKQCKRRTEINTNINKDPEKIAKTRATLKRKHANGELTAPKSSTPAIERDRRKKLSRAAKKRGLGGYVKGSGIGKSGWFKGIWCDSSWELAYVIWCIDHNKDISRCKDRRSYVHNGKTSTYIPDFEVDDCIVEIKGYKTPRWESKITQHPDITVLYESDLKDVFDYVKRKYGSDYTKLYNKEG